MEGGRQDKPAPEKTARFLSLNVLSVRVESQASSSVFGFLPVMD